MVSSMPEDVEGPIEPFEIGVPPQDLGLVSPLEKETSLITST